MDEFHECFKNRHRLALEEYVRLENMLRNVTWYNFETVCRKWRDPWPASVDESVLELYGMRVERTRRREKVSYPIYYSGPLDKAPQLPPQILLHELKLAHDLVRELEVQCSAPYDWAPGGALYLQMLRSSPGVLLYKNLSTLLMVD